MGYPGQSPEYSQAPGFYDSGGESASGEGSIDRINDLDSLQPGFKAKIDILLAKGKTECEVDLFVAETLRTFERSDYLYGIGRDYCRTPEDPRAPLMVDGKEACHSVTEVQAGGSYHNYGLAVDLYPTTPEEGVQFDFNKDRKLMKKMKCVVEIAEDNNLESGGNFNSFSDYPHFQPKGINIAQLRMDYPDGWQV